MKFYSILSVAGISLLLFSACKHKSNLPRPDHIIIVIEENHGYDELIGSANAPFINQLAKEGALFTDSHGVTHPSQPNYFALFSGSTQGVTGDDCLENVSPYTSPNLGALLISNGFTFKGYAQTLPEAGSLVCTSLKSTLTGADLYARKHAPWVNWQGDQDNNFPDSLSHPMTDFPKDFSKLPTVAFAIPDMDHDMHNIGVPGDAAAIQRGDQWLKENLTAYVAWAKTHNSLLILTFDEDDFKPVNHIPTIIIGGPAITGKYPEKINHYNVLHTIEAMYGITPKDSTNAEPITDIWKIKGE
jgi:phospholipase C